MTTYYVVVDADGAKLQWDNSPWWDGECLVDCTPEYFTLFTSKESALDKIKRTKQYLTTQINAKELSKFWGINKWKVEEFSP